MVSVASITGRTGIPDRAISQGIGDRIGLAYTHRGISYTAALRCVRLSVAYGLNAEQSHSRQVDAFYPHRRSNGTFTTTFACWGWKEYRQAMAWFTQFAVNALSMAKDDPAIYIDVSLPARNFSRAGIPTSGISFGDHTASMVFNPAITFVSVRSSDDPRSGVLKTKSVSHVDTLGNNKDSTSLFWAGDASIAALGSRDESLYGATAGLAPLTPKQVTEIQHGVVSDPSGGARMTPEQGAQYAQEHYGNT